jgi:sulfite reductase alpha subunit-like flavoprotein
MNKIFILFGSKYGNAETIAETIHTKLNPISPCELLDMDNYELIDFSEEQIIIIVTSTYNSGPPENAARFFRWLRNLDKESKPLKNIDVAILGIGDSNYDEFCKAAKDFERNLITCGASRLVTGPMGVEGVHLGPIGIADDGPNFNETVDTWINHLIQTIETIEKKSVIQDSIEKEMVQFSTQRKKWVGIIFCTCVTIFVINRINSS